MQYISQMQTWDLARKITKKSNLPVIDGPTILMKRRRREELWWVEPSEMCVCYCFPFWCFTICVRSCKFFFSFSCHFSSYFAKIVPRQFWIGQRGKLLKKAFAMISIINLIIIIIIVDVIFIFVFVIDIVIVLVIVIIIIIVILLQLLIITAFSLIIIIILFCSREKKTSLKPPWKFQFYS